MQLNIATLDKIEVDVTSVADAAVASIPQIPSILQPLVKSVVNGALTFAFNWLNEHFGTAPAAGSTVTAVTNPPSSTAVAAIASSVA